MLKQKRALPFKNALSIATKLNLSDSERTLFMESFYRSKTNIDNIKIDPLDERMILDESYYNIIAQWEHYAVLELFDLTDFLVTKKSNLIKE